MRYIPLLIGAVFLAACNFPVAEFVIDEPGDKALTAPATVTFENRTTEADSFFWSFGDGHFSTGKQATHTYYHSGNYQVSLKAFKDGRSRTKTERIQIAPPKRCLVLIETPMGDIVAHLYDETPQHRDNFLKLAKEGFYDSLLFHRVIEGFMIQGGDPASKNAPPGKSLGMGGPGYTISEEIRPDLIHKNGALAAARKGDRINPEKASSGSQFYIVDGKPVAPNQLEQISIRNGIDYSPEQKEIYRSVGGTPFLDGEYTVFGEIVKGLEVIDKIAAVATDQRNRPMEDIPMQIEVIR